MVIVSLYDPNCYEWENFTLMLCLYQHEEIAHDLTVKFTPMTYMEANYSNQDIPAASGLK